MIKQSIQDSNYSVDEMGTIYSRKGRVLKGSTNSNGYRQIFTYRNCKNTGSYLVHRMVWETFKGPVPDGYVVDHINMDTSDNRLENLRLLTFQQNLLHRESKNYCLVNGKWIVKITQFGKHKYFGSFATEEEAAAKAKEEKKKYFDLLVSQNTY
jgi:hypothetical protein